MGTRRSRRRAASQTAPAPAWPDRSANCPASVYGLHVSLRASHESLQQKVASLIYTEAVLAGDEGGPCTRVKLAPSLCQAAR